MKKTSLFVLLLGAAAGMAEAAQFVVTSGDVIPGKGFKAEHMLNGFGCSGGNTSPELKWTGAPKGTKSYAVSLYDPDAPTGSGWWHWVVYNIPTNVDELPPGAGDPAKGLLVAGAVNGQTDFGKAGYGGPCPPVGKVNHYRFTVTALRVEKIDVPANAPAAMVNYFVNANALAKATLEVPFGRGGASLPR